MPPSDCPDDDAILAFLARAPASEPSREALVAHFDACESCRELLTDLARTTASDADQEVAQGAQGKPAAAPDRYVLLCALGAGAMGVVQAAFDRQLDRKVALKFLSSAPGEDSARAQARLQREAQALAKLAHPNVVTVHDVGVLDGEVYVAMELVQGKNLREWLAARPRSVKEVLGILGQAGEGLAAAHAAGLVHRDFKPDNVLVGDDGRVRVTDFGLARSASEDAEAPASDAPTDARRIATLTQTGVRAGTPAYMAPEQQAGDPPSPRSDVYSFCVTLHEAVTGAGPGGKPTRRPPAWLERAMARGLRARPDDRWPTMRALLGTLARGPRVTPLRVAAGAAVVAIAAIAGVAVHDRAVLARAASPCPAPVHAFDGVWDDAQRAAVTQAMRASGHEESLAYVLRAFDGFASAWGRAEVDTCTATRVRGEQSEHLLDLRMACLDDRRRTLGRTVALLAKADADVAGHAVEIASGVPGIETCARARSLEETVAPSAGSEGAIAGAKLALDDGRALYFAGKAKDAHARFEPAIAEMTRIGYAPLLGQLLYWRGKTERDLVLGNECLATLVAAGVQALEAHDDATLAQVWTFYAFQQSSRPDVARPWVDQAGAAIRRLGGDDELEGERLLSLGASMTAAESDERKATLLHARELLVKTRGEDYYLVATVDQRLGNNAIDENRVDEATPYHTRALALRLRLFGPDHPATVSSTFNVAEDAIAGNRPAEARRALRELGTRIAQHVPGEQAWYAIKLGDIARLEGNLREAAEQHQRAVAYYDTQTGAEAQNPWRAWPYYKLGEDLMDLGRPADAVGPLETAARLWSTLSCDADAADTWFDLGRATFESGDTARGRALVRRAQATYAKYPKDTDPEMAKKAAAWLAKHG